MESDFSSHLITREAIPPRLLVAKMPEACRFFGLKIRKNTQIEGFRRQEFLVFYAVVQRIDILLFCTSGFKTKMNERMNCMYHTHFTQRLAVENPINRE